MVQDEGHVSENRASLDLAAIVRESADQIFLIDALSAQFVFANQRALEATGYTLEELRNMTPLDLQVGVTLSTLAERIAPLYQGERETVSFGTTYRRKDGSMYPVEHRVQLLRGQDPAVFLAQAREIAGHQANDAPVIVQGDLYRRMVEEADEGIWVIDTDNRTTYANEAIATMLGYRRDEMIGASVFEFMDDEWRAIAAGNLQRRRTGVRQQLEFKYVRRDGSDLWAIIATHPLFDESRAYMGAFAIVTDITERKLREGELLEKLHLVDAAEAAVSFGGPGELAVLMPNVAGQRAARVAKRFALLSEPRRLELVELLATGQERSVNALAASLQMSQSNVSKHLKVLSEANLVHRRQEGIRTLYSLADPTVAVLCQIVCRWLSNQAEAELRALAS